MFGAYGGFPPPPHGFNQGNIHSGPPPAKRVKNNPIITRYAPPPGYQPPPQRAAAFHQQPWPQHQAQHYPNQYHSGYQPQAYAQYPSYSQAQWHGYTQHQQNSYVQSHHAQQQMAAWTPSHATTPQSAPVSHPAMWQIPPSTDPMSAPPQSRPPYDFLSSKRRHESEHFVDADVASANPNTDGNGDPLPPPSPKCEAQGDLEDDFDGECYFLRHPADIDPSLSIGELVYRPAQQTSLALPATWKESQVELIAPRKNPPRGEDSVSEYFFRDKREEALLSIRLMDEWWEIKDDLIFREFSEQPKNVIALSEMKAKYRDRRDPSWRQRSDSETPEPTMVCDAVAGANHRTASTNQTSETIAGDSASEDGDILGDLEQALQQSTTNKRGHHSRANSTTSIASNHSTKLKPLMPVRDRAQDDVLAALGVTGSPKMVYQTPGPAFGPPPSQPREGSVSRDYSRPGSAVSNSSTARGPPPPAGPREGSTSQTSSRRGSATGHSGRPPPPPPPPGRPHYYVQGYGNRGGWHQPRRHGYDDSRRNSNVSAHSSRPGSSGSGRPGSSHTANGSDPTSADEDRTPRPKSRRQDSRKRGYEDDHGGVRDGDEDATPRQQKYKQPRVDDAYKRRW